MSRQVSSIFRSQILKDRAAECGNGASYWQRCLCELTYWLREIAYLPGAPNLYIYGFREGKSGSNR